MSYSNKMLLEEFAELYNAGWFKVEPTGFENMRVPQISSARINKSFGAGPDLLDINESDESSVLPENQFLLAELLYNNPGAKIRVFDYDELNSLGLDSFTEFMLGHLEVPMDRLILVESTKGKKLELNGFNFGNTLLCYTEFESEPLYIDFIAIDDTIRNSQDVSQQILEEGGFWVPEAGYIDHSVNIRTIDNHVFQVDYEGVKAQFEDHLGIVPESYSYYHWIRANSRLSKTPAEHVIDDNVLNKLPIIANKDRIAYQMSMEDYLNYTLPYYSELDYVIRTVVNTPYNVVRQKGGEPAEQLLSDNLKLLIKYSEGVLVDFLGTEFESEEDRTNTWNAILNTVIELSKVASISIFFENEDAYLKPNQINSRVAVNTLSGASSGVPLEKRYLDQIIRVLTKNQEAIDPELDGRFGRRLNLLIKSRACRFFPSVFGTALQSRLDESTPGGTLDTIFWTNVLKKTEPRLWEMLNGDLGWSNSMDSVAQDVNEHLYYYADTSFYTEEESDEIHNMQVNEENMRLLYEVNFGPQMFISRGKSDQQETVTNFLSEVPIDEALHLVESYRVNGHSQSYGEEFNLVAGALMVVPIAERGAKYLLCPTSRTDAISFSAGLSEAQLTKHKFVDQSTKIIDIIGDKRNIERLIAGDQEFTAYLEQYLEPHQISILKKADLNFSITDAQNYGLNQEQITLIREKYDSPEVKAMVAAGLLTEREAIELHYNPDGISAVEIIDVISKNKDRFYYNTEDGVSDRIIRAAYAKIILGKLKPVIFENKAHISKESAVSIDQVNDDLYAKKMTEFSHTTLSFLHRFVQAGVINPIDPSQGLDWYDQVFRFINKIDFNYLEVLWPLYSETTQIVDSRDVAFFGKKSMKVMQVFKKPQKHKISIYPYRTDENLFFMCERLRQIADTIDGKAENPI